MVVWLFAIPYVLVLESSTALMSGIPNDGCPDLHHRDLRGSTEGFSPVYQDPILPVRTHMIGSLGRPVLEVFVRLGARLHPQVREYTGMNG